MRRASRNRLTTLVVLASFLAANTLSGLLHDHPAEADGDHACCHQHSGGEGDHDEGATGARSRHDTALHDDDCIACRFAGQRSLSVDVEHADHFCQLSIKLVAAPCDSPAVTLARTAHSRAPPLPC